MLFEVSKSYYSISEDVHRRRCIPIFQSYNSFLVVAPPFGRIVLNLVCILRMSCCQCVSCFAKLGHCISYGLHQLYSHISI